jgi:hypothetical protein
VTTAEHLAALDMDPRRDHDDETGYRASVVASERVWCGDWQELPEHRLAASDEEIRIRCSIL